jgi:DNA-binding CsgD family transcriptional regulator
MTFLPSREVPRLLLALERLHAAPIAVDFFPELFGALEQIIPGTVLSLETLDTRTGASSTASSRVPASDPEGWRARVLELLPTHPAMPHLMADPTRIIAVSDLLTQRQFRNTALYQEIFKPLEVEFQLVVGCHSPGQIAGVTITRDREFTAVERQLAQAIAPHLALAHRNHSALSALRAEITSWRESQQGGTSPGRDALQALGFTPREAEVLSWIIQGKRDVEIAQIVGASPRTVQKHVQSILSKLGVETRTAAAMEALRRCRNPAGPGNAGA